MQNVKERLVGFKNGSNEGSFKNIVIDFIVEHTNVRSYEDVEGIVFHFENTAIKFISELGAVELFATHSEEISKIIELNMRLKVFYLGDAIPLNDVFNYVSTSYKEIIGKYDFATAMIFVAFVETTSDLASVLEIFSY